MAEKKSAERHLIDAHAKLGALVGDERADYPSSPERTAYNREFRAAQKLVEKWRRVVSAPAPSRVLVTLKDISTKVYHPGARHVVQVRSVNAKQLKRLAKAEVKEVRQRKKNEGRRSNGQRLRKSTPRIAIEHQRFALKLGLGPNSTSFLRGTTMTKTMGRKSRRNPKPLPPELQTVLARAAFLKARAHA